MGFREPVCSIGNNPFLLLYEIEQAVGKERKRERRKKGGEKLIPTNCSPGNLVKLLHRGGFSCTSPFPPRLLERRDERQVFTETKESERVPREWLHGTCGRSCSSVCVYTGTRKYCKYCGCSPAVDGRRGKEREHEKSVPDFV